MTPSKDAATGLGNGAGLVIEAATIKSLVASATDQDFTVAGTPITLNGTFSSSNSAALEFKGKAQHTGVLAFLRYSDFNFSVQNNQLSGLTAYATQPYLNTVSGGVGYFLRMPIKGAVSVSCPMETKLSTDTSGKESLSITGSAGFDFGRDLKYDLGSSKGVVLTLTAAGNGFVIRDGKLQDWDVQLDGRVDLLSHSFQAKATRLWYSANDPKFGKDTYGFSGTLFLTIGSTRTFTDQNKGTVAQEPSNFAELNCGTRDEPGFVLANGEVRRIDVGLSIKQIKGGVQVDGLMDYKGLKFRVADAGLYYDANAGTTERTIGFYGTLGTDFGISSKTPSGKKNNLGLASVKLGDRNNPGLQILGTWDPESKTWVNTWDVRDVTLRFTDFRVAGIGFNHVELYYKIPDKTKPDIAFWGGKVEVAVGDFYFGGSLNYKVITDPETGVSNTLFNGFSLSMGVDPTGDREGLICVKGVWIISWEVGVENWQDPDNWNFHGTLTAGIGKRIDIGDSDSKQPRKVYPVVVRGVARYYPSAGKITANVDVFLAAYWDKSAYIVDKTKGWKDLVGSGSGSLIIDWKNDFYRIDFQGHILDLVQAQHQIQLSKGELVLYSTVRLSPTPGSTFDFWPVNKIDVSASILLILAEKHKLFAGWAKIKIFFINQTVGFGYDFINKDGFWILGQGKVNELIALKDSYLNGGDGTEADPFKYTQVYTTEVDTGATGLYSSRYTVTIPFMTEDINLSAGPFTVPYAKQLDSSDIRVQIDRRGENSLRSGLSYTYKVELNPPQKISISESSEWVYRTGSIIVDIYPNSSGETDFTKTFASFGIDKLMVDIQVDLKQNSMFFNTGMDDRDTFLYAYVVRQNAGSYISSGLWDSTKKVGFNGKEYPLVPTQFDTFVVAQPTIAVPHPAPFDEYTPNLITFTAKA
ncbi:MAG: hypothetical protein ACKOS8_02880, partial [Gemmataceae bacterium]